MESQDQEKTIQERINEQIEAAEQRARKLSDDLKYKVDYHTFTEKDDNGNPTGKVFVAFTKQPHILVAAKAMDCVTHQNFFEAGNIIWNGCFLREYSDSQIEAQDKYKLGLMGRLGVTIDIAAPDVKKS